MAIQRYRNTLCPPLHRQSIFLIYESPLRRGINFTMPPLISRLLIVARSTLLVDTIRSEAPIGWNPARKRCCFNGTRRHSTKNAKRWTSKQQQEVKPRFFGGIRWNSAWRRADIATSPKRSDTKPLLGALFGASALAYLGSSFIAKEEDGDAVVTIHANESISVDDVEGKSFLHQ